MKHKLFYKPPGLPEKLIRLLFPAKCMVCDRILIENSVLYICPSCKKSLPKYERGFVKNFEVQLVDKLFSGFYYKEGMETAIHTMKFNNHPRLTQTMSMLLWEELIKEESIPRFDCIVPVPMYSKKKRQRGYNQTELLAKQLSVLSGVEMRTGLLLKNRMTKPQSRLKRKERLENLKGAFSLGKGSEYLEGKHVLLVDDVVTTGTTLTTCAKILREQGVCSVYAIVIAIA